MLHLFLSLGEYFITLALKDKMCRILWTCQDLVCVVHVMKWFNSKSGLLDYTLSLYNRFLGWVCRVCLSVQELPPTVQLCAAAVGLMVFALSCLDPPVRFIWESVTKVRISVVNLVNLGD